MLEPIGVGARDGVYWEVKGAELKGGWYEEGISLVGSSFLYWFKSFYCYSISWRVYLDTGWKDIPPAPVIGLSMLELWGLLSRGPPKFMEARDVLTWLTWTDYYPIDFVSEI